MATSFARNQSRQRLADLPLVARLADRFNRRNIISIALAFWSAMTVFCGMAQSVATQALARIGVGFGESGGPPASQSIIADLFSKNERPPARGVDAIGAYLACSSAISSAATACSTTWSRPLSGLFLHLGGKVAPILSRRANSISRRRLLPFVFIIVLIPAPRCGGPHRCRSRICM
jgi:MFS family permease